MALIIITPPAEEPLALDEAKTFARVDTDRDDMLVQALIVAARLHVEALTRRFLVTQGWRLVLDALPAGGIVRIPVSPLQAVTGVRLRDATGAATALDPASWQLDAASSPPRLVFSCGSGTASTRPVAGIEIDLTLGFGTAADVPEPLRQAIRLLVAAWYEDRAFAGIGQDGGALPPAVTALLAPYRSRSL